MSNIDELNSADSSTNLTILPIASTSTGSSSNNKELESISEGYYEHLLEVLIQGECLKAYRDHKLIALANAGIKKEPTDSLDNASEPIPEPILEPKRKGQAPKSKSHADIFGNTNSTVKKMECKCPNCFRKLAASRLAPHLEKCMSMGRDSSRVASKRIASYAKIENGTLSD